MGERKGVNKYYPPDFDYKKHGSLDKYHGTHPLRERASKISQGILIIRFEMPYNIWCEGCNQHIGMGVRYNAEKKKIGKYYSTIIYKFRMKCHLCDQYFEIQTDPQNCDYKILSGARRKEERWDTKANEQIQTTDHDVKKKLSTDPMFKLEHLKNDEEKMKVAAPTLHELQTSQYLRKDDYSLHRILRKNFRDEKKRIEEQHELDEEFLKSGSLEGIELLAENEEDRKLAKLYKYLPLTASTSAAPDDKQIYKSVIEQPIFKQKLTTKEQVALLLSKKKNNNKKVQQKQQKLIPQKRKLLGIQLHGTGSSKIMKTSSQAIVTSPITSSNHHIAMSSQPQPTVTSSQLPIVTSPTESQPHQPTVTSPATMEPPTTSQPPLTSPIKSQPQQPTVTSPRTSSLSSLVADYSNSSDDSDN